ICCNSLVSRIARTVLQRCAWPSKSRRSARPPDRYASDNAFRCLRLNVTRIAAPHFFSFSGAQRAPGTGTTVEAPPKREKLPAMPQLKGKSRAAPTPKVDTASRAPAGRHFPDHPLPSDHVRFLHGEGDATYRYVGIRRLGNAKAKGAYNEKSVP